MVKNHFGRFESCQHMLHFCSLHNSVKFQSFLLFLSIVIINSSRAFFGWFTFIKHSFFVFKHFYYIFLIRLEKLFFFFVVILLAVVFALKIMQREPPSHPLHCRPHTQSRLRKVSHFFVAFISIPTSQECNSYRSPIFSGSLCCCAFVLRSSRVLCWMIIR